MRNDFRVIIPRNADMFLELCENIIDKHTADGATSPLNGTNNLNMADMAVKYAFAASRNGQGKQLDRDKELATEQRNLALGLLADQKSYTPDTVLYYVTSIRDYLQGEFRGEEKRLGLWGFEVNTSAKKRVTVVVPRNAQKLMELGRAIVDKHIADDENSLLSDFDMEALEERLDYAEEQRRLALRLNKEKENAFQERNLAIGRGAKQRSTNKGTLLFYVSSVRDVLLGHFRGSEQQLGLWGFDVNTSQQPTPPDPDPLFATVQGTVTSLGSGAPLDGVTLVFHSSAGNVMFTTNTLGQYGGDIELPAPEGVTVEIFHVGFNSVSQVHPLTPEQVHVLNFGLMPIVEPN